MARKVQKGELQLALINEIGRKATFSLELEELSSLVVEGIQSSFGYEQVVILLLDEQREELFCVAAAGKDMALMLTGYRQSIYKGVIGHVARTGQSYLVRDAAKDPYYIPGPGILRGVTRSELCVPLKIEQRVLGVINLESRRKDAFDESDIKVMETIASQIAHSVENARLYRESKRRNEQIVITAEIARLISSSLKIEDIYERLADLVSKLLECNRLSIALLDESGMAFDRVLVWSDALTTWYAGTKQPYGSGQPGPLAWALENGRVYICRDTLLPHEFEEPEAFIAEGIRSYIIVPIISEGKRLGTLNLGSRQPASYNERDGEVLRPIADQLGVAILKSRLIEELRRSEQRYMDLYENAPVIYYSADPRGVILNFNRTGAEMLGYSKEEIIGRRVDEFIPQDQLFILQRAREQFYATGKIESVEIQLMDRAGNRVDVMASSTLICDPEGRPLYSRTVLRDITEKKKFEREVIAMRNLLAAVLEAVGSGVMMVDKSLTVRLANKKLGELLNINVSEMIGRSVEELVAGTIKPRFKDPERYERRLHYLYRNMEEVVTEELEMVRPVHRYLQRYSAPVYDESGQVAGRIEVYTDRTEQKHLEQQLIQSEKMAALGQLISGVAHELNNPLTGVIGFAELLNAQCSDPIQRQYLSRVLADAERAAKIVRNLLSFARQRRPEKSYVDVNQVLERVLEFRAYELKVSNITLIKELQPELPPVFADPHQLEQVFLNIIINAEQALEEIDAQRIIVSRTSCDRNRAKVIVQFEDSGPGIPPEILPKIFDPFFTTKPVGRGTGLGLSLVYSIIQEHGGTIRAGAAQGGGALFTIELPAAAGEEQSKPLEPSLVETAAAGLNVLVVDDEESVLALLRRFLEVEGLKVSTASSGYEAAALIKTHDFDLVMCDLKMPGLGGKELYALIEKSRPQLVGRVIFVTGDAIDPELNKLLQEAKVALLPKPFSLESVRKLVRRFGR